MEFNVGPAFLVNAGGALLFVVEGIAIFAIGRGRPRAMLLGILSLVFGLTFVADNLLVRGDSARDALIMAFAAPAILATLALTSIVARHGGRAIWGALAATALVFAVSFVAAFRNLVGVGQDLAWFVALAGCVALLMMAVGLRTRAPIPLRDIQRVPLALLTLGFGLWASFAQALTVVLASLSGVWGQVGTLGICCVTLAGIMAWAPPSSSAPWRLRVFLALAVAALVGIVLAPQFFTVNSVYGLFGVMRTAGAACLAIAVVKYDLLRVPLPHIVVKRGVMAGAALAILFIVAQVAQNFFSAQYGLLGGGIVAGTFLFAASPVQRAIENRQGAKPTAYASVAGNDDSFREAVELAFKDRRFTPNEELALARLATRLGVSAERATEIRHAVERGAT